MVSNIFAKNIRQSYPRYEGGTRKTPRTNIFDDIPKDKTLRSKHLLEIDTLDAMSFTTYQTN